MRGWTLIDKKVPSFGEDSALLTNLINCLEMRDKVGLLSQGLYGWKVFSENGATITPYLLEEVKRRGTIGFLYGVLRADPWSGRDALTGVSPEGSYDLLNRIGLVAQGSSKIWPFFVEEAPHGHVGLGSTIFPVNLAMGCTFNRLLQRKIAEAVGIELAWKGANTALIAGLDIALDPRWGRSEECYGEDTYLSAVMIGASVEGFTLARILPIVKHFIGQGSSLGGRNAQPVSMGTWELETHHLPIVYGAVKAGALGIMASYNDIDGVNCHLNSFLFAKIRESGFNGFFISDATAVDGLAKFRPEGEDVYSSCLRAGLDVDLLNESFNFFAEKALNNQVPRKIINSAVGRVLSVKGRFGLLDGPRIRPTKPDFTSHSALALQAAIESLVLLKNDSSFLPLKSLDDCCLIGPYIDDLLHQLGDYTPPSNYRSIKSELGIPSFICEQKSQIREVVKFASSFNTVLLNVGGSSSRVHVASFDMAGRAGTDSHHAFYPDSGEGVDLAEVKLSSFQQLLVESICEACPNVVLLVTAGRALGISGVSKMPRAILYSLFGGQEIAKALRLILVGKESPSGRLSVSLPYSSVQLPVYYWSTSVGKYFDLDSSPMYPFGFGMSYANFSTHIISQKGLSEVVCSIENKSTINAMKTVLVFAHASNSKVRPPKRLLVGFSKVDLPAMTEKRVRIDIDVGILKSFYKAKKITLEVD